jgi:hypothetical protein
MGGPAGSRMGGASPSLAQHSQHSQQSRQLQSWPCGLVSRFRASRPLGRLPAQLVAQRRRPASSEVAPSVQLPGSPSTDTAHGHVGLGFARLSSAQPIACRRSHLSPRGLSVAPRASSCCGDWTPSRLVARAVTGDRRVYDGHHVANATC